VNVADSADAAPAASTSMSYSSTVASNTSRSQPAKSILLTATTGCGTRSQ
jgi:hypothetical protein